MAYSTPQFMIRLCQPYGEIAYSYDLMIIINISLSVSCDFQFSFFFLQNTAGNQKTQVMAQGIFFPKVLHLLDYENDSIVSDDDMMMMMISVSMMIIIMMMMMIRMITL